MAITLKKLRQRLIFFIYDYKYEVLLWALLQHLFIGIVIPEDTQFIRFIFAFTTLMIGISSLGIYAKIGGLKLLIRNVLILAVVVLPLSVGYFSGMQPFMNVLSIMYTVFFAFILVEVMRYLTRPSYINRDIILAAACGYLLIIEISVFVMEFFYYINADSFTGIDGRNAATIFMDIVYYSVSTVTTVGYGDITATDHHVRLISSLIGIIGQFYLVVLMGIIVSKFTTSEHRPKKYNH